MPHELPSRTGSEEREDSTTERSKVFESTFAKDTASPEEPTPSQLKGKLLEQTRSSEQSDAQELSKLRGTLLEKKDIKVEPYSPEWLKMQTFVQRDSGELFIVKNISEGRNGGRITLMNTAHNIPVTLATDRFIERLQIPGEAWSVKDS